MTGATKTAVTGQQWIRGQGQQWMGQQWIRERRQLAVDEAAMDEIAETTVD